MLSPSRIDKEDHIHLTIAAIVIDSPINSPFPDSLGHGFLVEPFDADILVAAAVGTIRCIPLAQRYGTNDVEIG